MTLTQNRANNQPRGTLHVDLRTGSRARRRQPHRPDAAELHRAHRQRLSALPRGDPRQHPPRLGADLPTLPTPGLGPGRARHRPGRHGGGDAAEHPRDARGALWRADDRRGAEHPQRTPRRRSHRLHAATRRSQGADHRLRIPRGDPCRHRYARPPAAGGRRQRPRVWRRPPGWRTGLRGAARRGRPAVRLGMAPGRVAGDLAELHLGHHRQPQGRGLPSPRRLPERAGQPDDLVHGPAPGVPLDPADVPLQRLVLSVDGDRAGRRPRLPAAGRSAKGPHPDPRAPGQPPVRRAHRAQRPDQHARLGQGRHRPPGACHGRRRRATGQGDRRGGRDGASASPMSTASPRSTARSRSAPGTASGTTCRWSDAPRSSRARACATRPSKG